MSGIYGVVGYDDAPVTREIMALIADAMSFWGRDGHGQWCADSAGLGHAMLHVTPESMQERLPASIRAAPHLIITADARIDNRDELFDALGTPGPGRAQTPDSSLILLAYDRWGSDCVKRLLGDFAFAIWDSRERKLFCARDMFGCKPFVYYFGEKRFVFASDVKGVLAGLGSRRLNEPLLAAYLQMDTSYAQKQLTFFEGVLKLPPAHLLTVTANGVQMSRYWSPDEVAERPPASLADYAAQLEYLFRQSVKCRLRSAFHIGTHLSGGLDSSSIAVQAARILHDSGQKPAAFSWSPPPGPAERLSPDLEYHRIDAVCRQERLTCEYLPPTVASFIESFRLDVTVEPTLMMSREASVQARAQALRLRVMLSGWGGDDAVTRRATNSPSVFVANRQWSQFRSSISSRMETTNGNLSVFSSARKVAGMLLETALLLLPDSLYSRATGKPFPVYRFSCAQPAFLALHRDELRDFRGPALRALPSVHARIRNFLEYGHITARVEHWAASGARHQLEYRYPMLDKRLVEFALGVPPSPFRQTDQRRALFRTALGQLLPPSVDWDPAKSEPVSFAAIRRETFKAHSDWAHHLVSNMANSPATRFVDPLAMRKVVESSVRRGQVKLLQGVLPAFGCYSIKY